MSDADDLDVFLLASKELAHGFGLGLVVLGAMTSCSIKEDVSHCPKQHVYVDLRTLALQQANRPLHSA